MSEAYTLHGDLPSLTSPVLVVMLVGWIDASGAAAATMKTIEAETSAATLATFDPDAFIDFRARRPTMEIRDGKNTQLVWPAIELKAGRDVAGHDVVLLVGHEPDSQWHRFADAATALAIQLGCHTMVGLGAYPFATPHTRSTRLSCTSTSDQLLARLSFLKSSLDVPGGIAAVLEHSFAARGLPAISLWAQVPHYLAAMAYPAASVALLAGLAEVADVVIDAPALRREAALQRQRLDNLISGNDEHQAMVRELEAAYDQAESDLAAGRPAPDAGPRFAASGPIDSEQLPSGDELAAELEQYLRDQQGD